MSLCIVSGAPRRLDLIEGAEELAAFAAHLANAPVAPGPGGRTGFSRIGSETTLVPAASAYQRMISATSSAATSRLMPGHSRPTRVVCAVCRSAEPVTSQYDVLSTGFTSRRRAFLMNRVLPDFFEPMKKLIRAKAPGLSPDQLDVVQEAGVRC